MATAKPKVQSPGFPGDWTKKVPENIYSLVQGIINLVKVEDGCADREPEVHQSLPPAGHGG